LKRILSILAVCAILVTLRAEPWEGKVLTIVPGTAQRLWTGATQRLASSIFIQVDVGNTGVAYVLSAPVGVTCAYQGAGTTLITKLAVGTASAPGGSVTIPSNPDPIGGVNVGLYCVDVAGGGNNQIVASWNLRN
jgi:hypothetical protein